MLQSVHDKKGAVCQNTPGFMKVSDIIYNIDIFLYHIMKIINIIQDNK